MNPRYVPMHLLILLSLLLVSLIVPAAAKGQDLTSDETHILKTIHASIGWAKYKDVTLLHSVITNDSAYLEISLGWKTTRGLRCPVAAAQSRAVRTELVRKIQAVHRPSEHRALREL